MHCPQRQAAMAVLISIITLALANVAAAQIQQVTLPYQLESLEPQIDNATMNFHYGTHYATYVKNTNEGLANATGTSLPVARNNLTALIMSIRRLSSPLNTTIRNQGGGAWNHALYFKHLAPPESPATRTTAISPELRTAIEQSFGSIDNMTAELTTAASKVFGSGWAWLCYTGSRNASLTITTTPNQDNPLMGDLPGAPPVKAAGCTPILGIDVWEHAYYLKHGPKRPAYLEAFWKVVNWQQVSRNYNNARQGVELDQSEASVDALQQAQTQAVSATSAAAVSRMSSVLAAITAAAAVLLCATL